MFSRGTAHLAVLLLRRLRGTSDLSDIYLSSWIWKLYGYDNLTVAGVAVCQKPFRYNTSARWRCWKDFRSPEWRGV